MAYIAMEKLFNDGETSLFKLVLTASARANQLSLGAQPLIKTKSKKVSSIAMEELAAGKVRYVHIKEKGKKA